MVSCPCTNLSSLLAEDIMLFPIKQGTRGECWRHHWNQSRFAKIPHRNHLGSYVRVKQSDNRFSKFVLRKFYFLHYFMPYFILMCNHHDSSNHPFMTCPIKYFLSEVFTIRNKHIDTVIWSIVASPLKYPLRHCTSWSVTSSEHRIKTCRHRPQPILPISSRPPSPLFSFSFKPEMPFILILSLDPLVYWGGILTQIHTAVSWSNVNLLQSSPLRMFVKRTSYIARSDKIYFSAKAHYDITMPFTLNQCYC